MNRMNGVRCDEVGLNVLRCQAEVLGTTELGTLQGCVCTCPASGKIAEEGPAAHAQFCAISASGLKRLGSFLAAATDFPTKGTLIYLVKVTRCINRRHPPPNQHKMVSKKKGGGVGGCHLHCSMKGVYKQKVQGRRGSFTSQYGG